MTKYVKKSDYFPDVSGKLNASDFNSKVSELENEIKTAESKPDVSNLTTKIELSGLVKKSDYETEIKGIKSSYTKKQILQQK